MKSPAARSKPTPTKEEILAQITTLLDRPDDDIQAALMKEILAGVIRLSESQLDVLDLKIVNRALKELRHAFRVFQGYRQRLKISVFGSARTPADDPNYQLAFQFARRMVEEGYMTITGGADGIMRASQEGAGREHSFGVNIMLPFEQGANAVIADDPKLVTFKYFFTRKLMFQKESHAIALFPGGFGTHDEGFEIMTLVQTGKSDPKPIVCLQAPGCDYWDHWNSFITDQLLKRRLINAEDLSLFHHRRQCRRCRHGNPHVLSALSLAPVCGPPARHQAEDPVDRGAGRRSAAAIQRYADGRDVRATSVASRGNR
jgi:uncharacterized protein (TIGR00730 family)